ncbi:hypothetical protein ACVIHI_000125 [Bradyrhizobium sp. USDA 4524]|nr:hypothetical protein [Bradyrhizobium sp. USDA 4538]MCP1899076.1 hypothetical protein [Bradyrhizobium sp. USDA 4537]MCP1986811.1 hypothetical protein [Bradyrhizobium sp. USDA 4539]
MTLKNPPSPNVGGDTIVLSCAAQQRLVWRDLKQEDWYRIEQGSHSIRMAR